MYTALRLEFTTLDFHFKKILELEFSSIWVNVFNNMELEFTKLEFHVFFILLLFKFHIKVILVGPRFSKVDFGLELEF